MPNNLIKRMKQFLQQEQDYIWFTSPFNTQNRRHRHRGPCAMGSTAIVTTKGNDQEPREEHDENGLVSKNNSSVSSRENFQGAEQDYFEERVVYTTFPIDLPQPDFDEYIDRKFSNLDVSIRNEMKALLNVEKDGDMKKHIFSNDEFDGSVSATLIQILRESNANSNELEISVGYVKFTRKSEQHRDQLQHDWKNNTERVERALQYKYGIQLQRELS